MIENEIKKIRLDMYRYLYRNQKENDLKLFLKSISHIGFWALLNYRIGRYLRSRFNYRIVKVITGINKLIIEILTGISIPYSCEIGEGMLIGHFSGIIISSKAKIGKNVTLHQNVTIGAAGRGEKRGEPTIGDNVFIGAGAVILGNINIGNNVAIGANAVVTDNIPDNAVVVSGKAKIISYRGTNEL